MSCAPCSSDRALRSLLRGKLGRCRTCMRWARIGALTAWAVALGSLALATGPLVRGPAIAAAAFFSGLLLAHAVAYAVRATRAAPESPGVDGRLDRRRFLIAALGAAVLGVTGWRSGRAAAQQEPPPQRQECSCTIPDDGLSVRQITNDEWEVCVDETKVRCLGDCPEERPHCRTQLTCVWDRKATKATGGKLRFPKKKNKKGVEEDTCCAVVTVAKCPATVHAEVEVTVQCLCDQTPIGDPCKKTLTSDFTVECCCPPKFEAGIKREGDADPATIPGFDPATQRAVIYSAPAVPNNAQCTGACTEGGACDTKIECQWSVDGARGSKIVGNGKNCRQVAVVFTTKTEPKAKHFTLARTVKLTCTCGETSTATCIYESTFEGP